MFENYNMEVMSVFKEAEQEREKLHHEYVGTEHLLLALLKRNSNLTTILSKFNLRYDNFYYEVKQTLEETDKVILNNIYTPLLKRVIHAAMQEDKLTEESLLFHILDEGEGVAIRILISMNVDVDALYNYMKDNINNNDNLQIYKVGKLLNNYINLDEKVVGREKEINLIIETLLRKKKNNPLLIGDAGVGKSAIVEELARKIIKGDAPDALLDTKIVMLEMGSLVSGTRYRGEFEERLTAIIDEITQKKNIILFIDEIHTMINAGAAEGAISASDILKPYLARGDIKCIGATTKIEYEKYMLKDKALSRRFETILVSEPDEEETFNILKSIKNEYANFHKVSIKDETLKILIHLAGTYFPNKKNPDKSIELLDSVMSYVKLKEKNSLIKDKELELKKISISKIKELEKGNYKAALSNNILENKIKKELNNLKNNNKILVKEDDIIDVLEYKNNIIISKKHINNINKLLNSKYDNKVVSIINKTLLNKNKVTSFMFLGDYKSIINDLSKALNYNVIKVTDEKSLDSMYNKIKYYPSSIIVVNDNNAIINENIKKIVKDNIVEYQDEYISFNNAIVIITSKEKNIGFGNNYISNIPIDEIINFTSKKISI